MTDNTYPPASTSWWRFCSVSVTRLGPRGDMGGNFGTRRQQAKIPWSEPSPTVSREKSPTAFAIGPIHNASSRYKTHIRNARPPASANGVPSSAVHGGRWT